MNLFERDSLSTRLTLPLPFFLLRLGAVSKWSLMMMMERVFLSLSEERKNGGVRPMIFLGLLFTQKKTFFETSYEWMWVIYFASSHSWGEKIWMRGRKRKREKNEWTKMCFLSHTPHIFYPQDSTSFSSHFSSKHPHPSNLEGGILSWDWRKLVEKLKLLKVIHSISFLSCHSLPPRELFNYFPSLSSLK